jgi:hypothetical protein
VGNEPTYLHAKLDRPVFDRSDGRLAAIVYIVEARDESEDSRVS